MTSDVLHQSNTFGINTHDSMKQNRLLLLLGALIVLLGVAYLAGVFDSTVSTVDVPRLAIPADELEQLRIETPAQTLALTRQGTRWRLDEPVQAMTDSATVARFVKDLGDLELDAVASNNTERYTRYGVDSTATAVTASWAGQTRRLVVGKQGPDYQAVYVRLDDDPRVYVTRGRLTVPPGLDRWRDKTVLDLAPDAVASVTVQRPDQVFEIRRGPGGWEVAGPEAAPADSASVAQWLRRFAPMTADGFVDDVPPALLDSAVYHLAFRTTTGATEMIRLMEHDGVFAVTNAAGTATFRLQANRLDSYFPDPETLK